MEYKAASFEDIFYGEPILEGTVRADMRDLTIKRLNDWYADGRDAFGPYSTLLRYCGKPNADADIIGPDEFMQKCLGLAI